VIERTTVRRTSTPESRQLSTRVQADKEQVTHTLHLTKELGGQLKQTAKLLPPLTV